MEQENDDHHDQHYGDNGGDNHKLVPFKTR
jgi:hypothetical protein